MLDVSRPKNEAKRSINQSINWQNVPQKLPKSSENPPKIHPKFTPNPPKSIQNHLKFLQNRSQNRSKIESALRMRPKSVFSRVFFDCLMIFDLPKSSQNRKKTQKSAKKAMLKKHMFFNTIFSRFFSVWTSKTTPKSSIFSIFFENVDFAKILTKHWLCAQKSRFGR